MDLLHRRITVRESISDVNGRLIPVRPKNGQVRSVALAPFLVPLLEPMLKEDPDAYLFPGRNGNPRRHGNWMVRRRRPVVASLGLVGLRFHDLRHSCASILIHQGVHPAAIKDHLGHSSIAVTIDRYGHLYPHDDRVANALQSAWSPSDVATSTG